MRFVETPVFTTALRRHLDDETYRALQLALVLRPEQGPIIPGGGGAAEAALVCRGTGKARRIAPDLLLGSGEPHVLYALPLREERAG